MSDHRSGRPVSGRGSGRPVSRRSGPPVSRRRSRRPTRAGRSTAALLGVLTLLAVVTGIAPARALTPGPEDDTGVRIELRSLTPAAPTPGDVLTISGVLRNNGAEALPSPQVRLRFSRVQVSTREELDRLATGETSRNDIQLSSTAVTLPDVAPGTAVPFTLSVPLDRLDLGQFGVYPLRVEARSDRRDRLAITPTFLPWSPDPLEARPTQVVWIWPVADVPRRLIGGAFVDDALARSLAPSGRLGSLVGAAAGREVTWAVDPMLLEDARDMSAEYAVATGSGDPGTAGPADDTSVLDGVVATSPGSGTQAAGGFVAALRQATDGRGVVALPYGDADVTALVRDGGAQAGGLLREARSRGGRVAGEVLARPVTTTTAVPPGGFLDTATADALAADGVDSVVLRDDALPAEEPAYTPTGRGTVPVTGGGSLEAVLTDTRLSALAAAETTSPGARVLAQQRFLAETAMVTAERPGVRRTIAIAPPTRWNPEPGWAASLLALTDEAPWLSAVTLDEALATDVPTTVDRAPLRYPGTARDAELPARQVSGAQTLGREVDQVAAVLTRPGDLADQATTAQLSLVSAALRDDEDRRAGLLRRDRAAVARLEEGVTILPTSVSLGGETFPVTVANALDQPVRVVLSYEESSPRIEVDDSDVLTIEPGTTQTVNLVAHTRGNGVTQGSAQLLSPAGAAFGERVAVPVRVAKYSGAGVVLTVLAAALLFAAAARQVLRRTRRRGADGERIDGDTDRGIDTGIEAGIDAADGSEPAGAGADEALDAGLADPGAPRHSGPHRTPGTDRLRTADNAPAGAGRGRHAG